MYETIQDKLKPLLEKAKQISPNNLEFIIAGSTYVIANISDYLLTVSIIGTVKESNPAITEYVEYFGAYYGLQISKAILITNVLIGLKAVDSVYKDKITKIKVKSILYSGSVLTALGGLSWLLFK